MDRDATIGWLTFLARVRGLLTISRLGSLISAEGLTHSSLLLTENMPLKPMCSYEQSILTVFLLKGVPSRFRGGQIFIP
ncbi:MAG: hypothetical protein M1410_03390 [Candidatus Thermoplasmatota archaeon]|nr:hypothetical protein [Candidatus Thermoplasmatota archaeon]